MCVSSFCKQKVFTIFRVIDGLYTTTAIWYLVITQNITTKRRKSWFRSRIWGQRGGGARLSVDQYTFVEEGLRGALGSRARSANKVPARAEGPRLTYFVLYTKISTLPLSLFLWTNAPHKTVSSRCQQKLSRIGVIWAWFCGHFPHTQLAFQVYNVLNHAWRPPIKTKSVLKRKAICRHLQQWLSVLKLMMIKSDGPAEKAWPGRVTRRVWGTLM